MWIHSITLRNFKSYDHAAFSFPEPGEGKNIVLIGAQNGHGKTTLLEAVYLCLYDKDAISHLQRAGLNMQKNNYPEFLKSALYHEAESKYGRYTMSLEIEIRQNYREAKHGLRIRRNWYFSSDRNLIAGEHGSLVTAEILKNGQYELIDEKDIDKYTNAFALPFDYAPFFFFDGEKIVQTAQQSGTGLWLNTALKGLLGVTLLEKLRVSLKDYRSKCISEGATEKIQNDLREAEAKLQSAEATLQVCRDELAATQEQWQQAAEERERLTQQLGGGGDIRTSEELLRLREKLEKEMAEFEAKVKAAVKAMPLAFLPRESLKALQQQLEKEKNRLNHEAGKNQIAEKVDDFWNAFVSSEKVNQALGPVANMILGQPLMKEAVKDCWEDLFYPLPSECADKIEHNYLSVNAHAEIQNEINRLQGMPQDKIGMLLAENEKRAAERKKISAEIELLKGTNKDELVEQLKAVTEETEKFKERTGHLKSNESRQEKDFKRWQKEVEDLQDKISDSNPKLLKSRRAGEVDKVIIRLTEELLKKKVKEVGEAATRINRAIAHDERIDRIRVESDGRMGIFGKDGYESRVDLSAGQMQILIMALVSALAEVTRYRAPFIIDTPLARLDEGHREGLFKHWCNLEQQVILLSQDTEITPEVYYRLEPSVSRTYLVEAESLNSAGARSRISADVYFE
ncbi:AAA family ATPase [Uruburuella testudinis]|uniref:AAA family ATPase n=1 Tax=Uruburuella testudinis TaxID=1282863 RepID=A0ABY4DVW3_9NEIS|nr:AAA family ATPase [Uruburuella testudinis]UOO83162.1 AAA family ATPase [Uruburuella testudinis]